jgi:hypothetical protein
MTFRLLRPRARNYSLAIGGLIFVAAIDNTCAVAQTPPRLVVAKYWNCVLDHAASYRELSVEPVIIFLSLCPTAQPSAEDLAKLASNLGDVPEFAKSKLSNTLVMSKATLDCVLRRSSQIAKSAGQDREWGELITLDVDACRDK